MQAEQIQCDLVPRNRNQPMIHLGLTLRMHHLPTHRNWCLRLCSSWQKGSKRSRHLKQAMCIPNNLWRCTRNTHVQMMGLSTLQHQKSKSIPQHLQSWLSEHLLDSCLRASVLVLAQGEKAQEMERGWVSEQEWVLQQQPRQQAGT